VLQRHCFDELVACLDGLLEGVLKVFQDIVHLLVLLAELLSFIRFIPKLLRLFGHLVQVIFH